MRTHQYGLENYLHKISKSQEKAVYVIRFENSIKHGLIEKIRAVQNV